MLLILKPWVCSHPEVDDQEKGFCVKVVAKALTVKHVALIFYHPGRLESVTCKD